MSIRDDFFSALESGARWDVGVSIDRSNPLPLDSRSVFKSLTDAQTYAEGVFSYPGQVIAVVSDDNKVAVYALDGNKTLQEMGSGSGSAMLFVSTIAALTTLGTPPTGVPADLKVGQQAFVSEDKKIHFLTSIGTEGNVTSYVWQVQASDAPTWNGGTNLVGFDARTSASYEGLGTPDENVIYFLTDVGKIFKGGVDVTSSVEVVSAFGDAANAVIGKIYVGPAPSGADAGYEIRIKSGTSWLTINPGYYTDGANWASADSNKFATIGLIKKGITAAIDALSLNAVFDTSAGTIKVGEGQSATLTGVAHGITYDSSALKITIPQYGSEDLVINIPKDKFVTAGQYYEDYPVESPTHHKVIVLTIDNQEDPVIIPAEALVNIYTADNTNKDVVLTISDDNVISAAVKIDPATGNALKTSANGLIVDISGKMDKIAGATGSKIVISNADGSVVESDKSVDDFVAKVVGTANNIVIFGDDGTILDSGVKAGGASLSESHDANTLATESAVAESLAWNEL